MGEASFLFLRGDFLFGETAEGAGVEDDIGWAFIFRFTIVSLVEYYQIILLFSNSKKTKRKTVGNHRKLI